MSVYLQVILWWAVVPTIAVGAGCGIWKICTHCWREYKLAKLWDEIAHEIGAGRVDAPPLGLTATTTRVGAGNYPRDAA